MEKNKLLDSWKEISYYLNRSQRTCYRWEKELGLPINRFDENSPRSKVFAYQSEIDQWLQNKSNTREIRNKNSPISRIQRLIPNQNHPFSSGDYIASDHYLSTNYISDELKKNITDPLKLCIKGKYYQNMNTMNTNEVAINLFCKAMEINTKFVPALIGLAKSYLNYAKFSWNLDPRWLNYAKILLKKAQSINPNLPEYFSTKIELHLIESAKFNRNKRKTAIELSQEVNKKYPDHPQLNSIVGSCYYLKFGEEGNRRDFNKALDYKEKSFWLDPFGHDNLTYAEMLMLNKEFFKALNICNKLVNHNSPQQVKLKIGEIHYYMGDLDKSKSIFQQCEIPFVHKITSMLFLGMIASQKQKRELATVIANRINSIVLESCEKKFRLASIFMGIGENKLAYRYLKSFFRDPRVKKRRFIYYKYIDIDQNFHRFKDEIKMRISD